MYSSSSAMVLVAVVESTGSRLAISHFIFSMVYWPVNGRSTAFGIHESSQQMIDFKVFIL